MASREEILRKIKANKPAEVELPVITINNLSDSLLEKFTEVLRTIGGDVEIVPKADLESRVKSLYPAQKHIATRLFATDFEVSAMSEKEFLKNVDVAVIQGEIAVAENGCIWVSEEQMLHRALPFINQHLVLVIEESMLVPDMHQAYAKIKDIGSYGVFIAGPSKTADIEQSLVIGAHGARSMRAFVIRD